MEKLKNLWEIDEGYDWVVLSCPFCNAWFSVLNNASEIADYIYCPKCGEKLVFEE